MSKTPVAKKATKKEASKVEAVEAEIVIYKEKISGMKSLVEKTEVKDQASAEKIAEIVQNIKLLSKKIKEKMEKTTLPAKAIIEEQESIYKPMIKECKDAEEALKGKYATWFLAEEKRQAEEEKKIADKVESGYIKPETAVEKLSEVVQVNKTTKSVSGAMITVKKVAVAIIAEPEKVPDAYWVRTLDEKSVKAAALARHKSGLPQIPGVVIEMRADTSSR